MGTRVQLRQGCCRAGRAEVVGASRAARGEEVGAGRYGWMDGSMECTGCARGSRRIGRGDPEVGCDPMAAVEGQTSYVLGLG